MKKILITLGLVGALMMPVAAQAADGTTVSGFGDFIYTASDDAGKADDGCVANKPSDCKNSTAGKNTGDGEIDFAATKGKFSVRIDLDVRFAPSEPAKRRALGSEGDDAVEIEQAYLTYEVSDAVTFISGGFNNPIGQDAEDAPDMNFTSHTVVYNILDNQTVMSGNNVAGIATAINLGTVNLTLGYLNDLYSSNESNSAAVVVNASLMDGLDLELGMVTQAGAADSKHNNSSKFFTQTTTDNPTTVDKNVAADTTITSFSAGTVTNFNVAYSAGDVSFGIDYLSAAKAIKSATNIWLGYSFGDVGIKVGQDSVAFGEIDSLTYDATGSVTVTTSDPEMEAISRSLVYASYKVTDNLSFALQVATGTNKQEDSNAVAAIATATAAAHQDITEYLTGISDGGTTTIEAIATF